MQTRWSKEEIEIVKNLYLKHKVFDIVKILPNRTKQAIKLKAMSLKLGKKVRIPKYEVDDNFFDIPNPINSYLAGFIAADGCIASNTNSDIYRLKISQKEESVLILFKEILKYEGKIHKLCKKNGRICHNITISSNKIVSDLKKNFNIIPRKTHILKPPNLNEYNTLCFIIGLVDGDGCITLINKDKPGSLNLRITSTKEICNFVKDVFNVGNVSPRKNSENIYTFACSYTGAREVILKLRSIKELEKIRFSRKWDKILQYERGLSHE